MLTYHKDHRWAAVGNASILTAAFMFVNQEQMERKFPSIHTRISLCPIEPVDVLG